MASPQVQLDMQEGMGGSFHIIKGMVLEVDAIVTGLASDGNGNYDAGGLTTGQAYQRIMNAVRAVCPPASGCPGVTDPHYLESYGVPVLLSPDAAKVKITYRGFPAIQIRFNSSVAQVLSNVDNQGNPIIVSYTYPANYGLPASYLPGGNVSRAGGTLQQNALVPRPVPHIVLTVIYTSSGLSTITAMANLAGCVNKDAYPIGTIPGAPRTWMWTAPVSASEDGGITYTVSQTMAYNPSTWDVPVAISNPDDGLVPPDVVAGTGTKLARMATETSFPVLI